MSARPDPSVKAPPFVEVPRSFEGWPPKLDRALLVTRASLTVAIFAGFWLYFAGLPWPAWAVVLLALSCAAALVGILLALESVPSEAAGKVTSRGGRR